MSELDQSQVLALLKEQNMLLRQILTQQLSTNQLITMGIDSLTEEFVEHEDAEPQTYMDGSPVK